MDLRVNPFEWIFCDIDGTISDCRHRQHLAHVDWDSFHLHMKQDAVVPPVLHLLQSYRRFWESKVVFITGRPEKFRSHTVEWLAEKCDMFILDDYEALLMRPEHEFRSDIKIKPEILQDWLAEKGIQISANNSLFLDDRDAVVAMWRDMGYHCWQTATGAF